MNHDDEGYSDLYSWSLVWSSTEPRIAMVRTDGCVCWYDLASVTCKGLVPKVWAWSGLAGSMALAAALACVCYAWPPGHRCLRWAGLEAMAY